MELRDYQSEAVESLIEHLLHKDNNPCVVLPTGSGKSIVLAALIRQMQENYSNLRVCVLAHVKELVRQNAQKMKVIWPEADIGVFSAGLGRKQYEHAIVFAGIQSIAKKSLKVGKFDLIIIDEAHRLPPEGEGQYRQFIEDQGKINEEQGGLLKVVGLTATPFRTKSGWLCGEEEILNEIVYEANVKDLIKQKFLCHPTSRKSETKINLSKVRTQMGEFVQHEMEERFTIGNTVSQCCEEIVQLGEGRKKWLIFSSGIKHAEMIEQHLQGEYSLLTGLITQQTPRRERDTQISQFNNGFLQVLVNVNVLTEGFDNPAIDFIALLRATKSPGLYAQMVGRGLRIAEEKLDCLIADFGGNISRHGPIDVVRPTKSYPTGEAPIKSCPQCGFDAVPIKSIFCPECGYEFNIIEEVSKIDTKASDEDVLSGTKEFKVDWIKFKAHLSIKSGIWSLQVNYHCGFRCFREWICLEHDGYARKKAENWWYFFSGGDPAPEDVHTALKIAEREELIRPDAILVDNSDKYPKILKHYVEANKQQMEIA